MCYKVNSWESHKANSLGCHEANSDEFGEGLFLIIALSCHHLMGVVHTVHVWQEFDAVNSKIWWEMGNDAKYSG